MTELIKRNALRSCATVIFSVIISVCAKFNLAALAAVCAGCILGGIQGSSAAGLFLLALSVGVPLSPEGTGGLKALSCATGGFLWGAFFASLAAGLILGKPHRIEQKNGIKFYAKTVLAVTAAFAVYFACAALQHFISEDASPIFSTQDMILSIPAFISQMAVCLIFTLFLRPISARILFPDGQNALNEAREIMAS